MWRYIGIFGIISFLGLIVLYGIFNNPIDLTHPVSNALAVGLGVVATIFIAIIIESNDIRTTKRYNYRKNFYLSLSKNILLIFKI